MARTPIALPDHLGRVLEDWIEIVLGSVFLVGYLVGIVLSARSLKLRLLVLSVLVALLLASLYWPLELLEIALGSAFLIGGGQQSGKCTRSSTAVLPERLSASSAAAWYNRVPKKQYPLRTGLQPAFQLLTPSQPASG